LTYGLTNNGFIKEISNIKIKNVSILEKLISILNKLFNNSPSIKEALDKSFEDFIKYKGIIESISIQKDILEKGSKIQSIKSNTGVEQIHILTEQELKQIDEINAKYDRQLSEKNQDDEIEFGEIVENPNTNVSEIIKDGKVVGNATYYLNDDGIKIGFIESFNPREGNVLAFYNYLQNKYNKPLYSNVLSELSEEGGLKMWKRLEEKGEAKFIAEENRYELIPSEPTVDISENIINNVQNTSEQIEENRKTGIKEANFRKGANFNTLTANTQRIPIEVMEITDLITDAHSSC
jgi:hypothetical protein